MMFESMLPSFPAAKIWSEYSDHIEIFQSHVEVEKLALLDYFVWGLKFTIR